MRINTNEWEGKGSKTNLNDKSKVVIYKHKQTHMRPTVLTGENEHETVFLQFV